MDELLIVKTIFIIILTIYAIVLVLLAYILYYKYLIQEKRCTSKVSGTVEGHVYKGHYNQHVPIVSYKVQDKEYKIKGPFEKSRIIINISSPRAKKEVTYKEINNIMSIRKENSIFSIEKNDKEIEYPIGTKLDVFYDPKNPKLAYVLKYCDNKWQFYFMITTAVIVFIIDLLIIFLLK